MGGCLHSDGRWLLGASVPVFVVCSLLVGCRSGSGAGAPTGEAAFEVRAASVLVDCVWRFVVACNCLRLLVSVIGVIVCS